MPCQGRLSLTRPGVKAILWVAMRNADTHPAPETTMKTYHVFDAGGNEITTQGSDRLERQIAKSLSAQHPNGISLGALRST